ncbi:putative glycoside hydrolase [Saccharopolyspora sp. 6V]|nr:MULTISPECIES: putative glycoside hydrolase [unclassified Saccharopolyspora]MCA1196030.1 putative glycoside hydrolase [Saccharopolyspora sp. 6V]MCA1283522.1 putative glycoside hydrolase [Saccharopolyspora sp. 7B]
MTEPAPEGAPGPTKPSRDNGIGGIPQWAVVAVAVIVLLIAGYVLLRMLSTEDVRVDGLPSRPVRAEATADGSIQIRSEGGGSTVLLDGKPVPTTPQDGAVAVHAAAVPDGSHVLEVVTPRAISWLGSASTTQEFTVDSAPPELQVEDSLRPEKLGEPVTVTGKAAGADQVTVAGEPVRPGPDGAFSAVVDRPEREVQVVATDLAGNRAERTMTVHIKHPGMRAVHMTGLAWTSDSLREPVLELARQGRIDTVELDIKDESGEIPYDSALPEANRIGAVKNYYDAREALDQLHGMGVRVVGRLVAFKDPVLGEASWREGHRERVVQTADGQPWSSGYGDFAFTNFADPAVRQYNIDLAAEAASLGFDDVLYDYVRRPDGGIEKMRFAGLRTTPEQGIADFLRDTQTAVRSKGALLGASVFGIAVDRPTQIAQDIPRMAKYVDYIAPMVYPSHWGPGEFGVDDPNTQPYEIVQRSLAEFAKAVEGTDVQIIPWLQDFSLGASYGPAEVGAQIKAARDDGMPSYLLWAPNCRYHGEALVPQQP